MTCAEDHDVLKELATAAADPPLRGSVLPWAAKRSANGFCARCFDELDDRSAKDEVAVEDEISRSGVAGKRLTQLLNNPSRRLVERGVEVNDVPTTVLDDEEAVQQPERRGGHKRDATRAKEVSGRYPAQRVVGPVLVVGNEPRIGELLPWCVDVNR